MKSYLALEAPVALLLIKAAVPTRSMGGPPAGLDAYEEENIFYCIIISPDL